MEAKSDVDKGKGRKYVLYTVMNDGAMTTRATWFIRILLGVLLLIALAVVPYASLRFAQYMSVPDGVILPVSPRTNKFKHKQPSMSVHDVGKFNKTTLQSASLVKESVSFSDNVTEQELYINLNQTNLGAYNFLINQTLGQKIELGNNFILDSKYNATISDYSSLSVNGKVGDEHFHSELNHHNYSLIHSTPVLKPQLQNITSRPALRILRKKEINHQLAYVATATSGDHVGGFCLWKTNNNPTRWSYFYGNIPVEYQSIRDVSDREMRTLLVATRVWSEFWYDYHVALRSQNTAIKTSNQPTKIFLDKELEKRSEHFFTYELEWRLRRDDILIKIAYSLARLHRDYAYWLKEFEKYVDSLLGEHDWDIVKNKNRIEIHDDDFSTGNLTEYLN